MVMRHTRMLPGFLGAALALIVGSAAAQSGSPSRGPNIGPNPSTPLKISRIYWEYNSSADDLGVHVSLDGEDWKELKIVSPNRRTIFEVEGKGPYEELGMTELFFEGAEPALSDIPLDELLARFPEGQYKFKGRYADGRKLTGVGKLSYAIPDGPTNLSAVPGSDGSLVISWDAVTVPPVGFPDRPLNIVGYQVIVEKFEVTVPGTTTSVTVSPEFVASLSPGPHAWEVLAIDESGNQTLREGSLTITP